MKLDPFLELQKKKKKERDSKWIKDVNVRPETVKLLNYNMEKSFMTLVLALIPWI